MKPFNIGEQSAKAIMLADEVNKLIRSSVGSAKDEAIAGLSMAANKANQLQYLCTKIKREINNVN